MKSLISKNDFVELFQFPESYLGDLVFVESTGWANKAQTECLKKMLGYSAFKELSTAYNADATLATNEKWRAFVFGAEYTVNDVLYKWDGIKDTVVAYCFCEGIKKKMHPVLTTTGATVSTNENEELVSVDHRFVPAWNQLIDYWVSAYDFLNYSEIDYTGVAFSYIGCYTNSLGI